MIEMGLIDNNQVQKCKASVKEINWANVIFTLKTKSALNSIWTRLSTFGLNREEQDLNPITDWDSVKNNISFGSLIMAGRFGQWKYYWSDDCVLRGKTICENI
jgi:hypothetical protein